MIKFTQQDIQKIAQDVYAAAKLTKGWSGLVSVPLENYSDFTVAIDKACGDLQIRLGDHVIALAKREKYEKITSAEAFSGIVKKLTDDFSATYNAIEKGESVSLPVASWGLDSKIRAVEAKRDLTSYIRSGNPTPVTRPQSYNMERHSYDMER